MIKKLLIANRGEIAVRIIRACKELSIKTVAIYSKTDSDSLHVQYADESICIGGNALKDSYLNVENILSAAKAFNVDAIHPGYGLLSENSFFIKQIEKQNIIFVGPSSNVVGFLGDKISARKSAKELGIPVLEGSYNDLKSLKDYKEMSAKIGYPILLKASNSGGGKGIKKVDFEEHLEDGLKKVLNEIESNFGESKIFIEKYLENCKHIEVQILADKFGNIIHLGSRDCSLQINNQKVIEESTSHIDQELLSNLYEDAIKLCKNVGYINAGTVEFLVEQQNNYYFLEVNPRIQVEHPVTEMITGIDIIKQQIKIAENKELEIKQSSVNQMGHAIECRIKIEQLGKTNTIKQYVLPGGFGVRIDTHIYSGYMIPPFYDPMIAKLIVHASDRKTAIIKMIIALEEFIVDGIVLNIEFLYKVLHSKKFLNSTYDTKMLDDKLDYESVFKHE